MTKATNENRTDHVHYEDPLAVKKIFDSFITVFPRKNFDVIALCIGTDRSTGDSLGPLTGTFLSKFKPNNIHVYGTLHHPVHAVNLIEYLDLIKEKHENPFIIAIDASLGKISSIGHLITGVGPLQPGAALNKQLPPVGDVYLTGVVNISGFMDYSILQSTRLSVVHDMAYKLSLILYRIDNWITRYKSNQLVSDQDASNF